MTISGVVFFSSLLCKGLRVTVQRQRQTDGGARGSLPQLQKRTAATVIRPDICKNQCSPAD